MPTFTRRSAIALAVSSLLVVGVAACSGDAADGDKAGDKKITVYSGRNEKLVGPLLKQFTEQTGIDIEVRYGGTSQLAAQLLEEGDRSPADVFFAQDAGALGAVSKGGLFAPLSQETVNKVPNAYRAGDGTWVGVTARARVLVHNPDLVPAEQLPRSVFDLTRPEWKGKVGIAPTNASFQAFVTAIRVQHGDAKAKEFLAGLKANDPQIRDNNVKILEDVDSGKIAVGLINHYYVGELAHERGTTLDGLKARLYFFPDGDTGALVNVAGVGILKRAAQDPDAQALVDYLLSPDAQRYFAQETFEYPVVADVAGPAGIPALSELAVPNIDLNDLDSLNETIALITESGLVP